MGIPRDIVTSLAALNNSSVFVETGTFHGETTKWAANRFETVHTIERAEGLHNLHRHELAQIKGVTPHLGDSRTILPRIVEQIGSRKAVFWLDSHWSGLDTAGVDDECPLIDELSCLSGRHEDIILIDDARLFLCAPPPPHNPSHWPTIPDICSVISRSDRKPFVQIVDDVIFIIPDEAGLRNCLVDYAQRRSNLFWGQIQSLINQRGK
jgi:hypothetical protein